MTVLREVAEQFASAHGYGDKEAGAFVLVMEFLDQNPAELSWGRAGKTRPAPQSREYYQQLAARFFSGRANLRKLSTSTVPDEMVSFILQQYFEYPATEIARIKAEHSLAMAAENLVGYLLEKYIGKALEQLGWVWVSGDLIRAVDLLKKHRDGTWVLLQVKNRDNSENSSSSAIRVGTEIKKWFRTFSRSGKLNWDAFPDPEARALLSEEGFKQDVLAYVTALKAEQKQP